MSGWHSTGMSSPYFALKSGEVGVDRRRVLAVGDDRRRRLAEDRIERVGVVDQHVAGRGAHEHLDARRGQRIQRADRLEVVVAGAQVEPVVAPGAPRGAVVLVLQRGGIERRRRRVGHVHEAGQPAGDRRRGFGGDVGLVFQAGFAEMHLVVDHARQQPAAGGVDHVFAVARRQAAADLGDATAADAQVAIELAAFVDQAGVDDQGFGHSMSSSRGGEGGTGSCPPGCSGWQRPMRRSASQPPLTAPNRAIAVMAYSEQVGTKRQRGPSRGLSQRL